MTSLTYQAHAAIGTPQMERPEDAIRADSPRRVGLGHGDVVRIVGAPGTRVRVETGSLWVTQEHSCEDVLLRTGETFRTVRGGTTVVTALGRRFALMTVEPSAKSGRPFLERFGKLLAAFQAKRSRLGAAAH